MTSNCFNASETTIQNIELIDIEDIVPVGGNSLFLSCSRALIYMANRNLEFINALHECSDINLNEFKSDIQLQSFLRSKLCSYLIKNAVISDKENNSCALREEYSKFFGGNIYDFLIQLYQLSINNFSNNSLYRKYALIALCQILNIKIYYRKCNGNWKLYEPISSRLNFKNLEKLENQNCLINNSADKKKHIDYLNNLIIYLQEFRVDPSLNNKVFCRKNVRILLDKKKWLSNYAYNSSICLKFSQFNDEEELRVYQEQIFTIDSKIITNLFNLNDKIDLNKKIFCVFISTVPVQIILNCEYNPQHVINSKETFENQTIIDNNKFDLIEMEFSPKFNTIGKQILKFEAKGKEKLLQYLNHLWGKVVYTDNYVQFKFSLIKCESNLN